MLASRSQQRDKRAKQISRRTKNSARITKVHRATAEQTEADGTPTAPRPKSMVFRRGTVSSSVLSLISDLRLVMSPDTAIRLQERSSNSLRDFLAVGPQLGVSHFLCVSQSEVGVNLRMMRVPHGPTLTFRVVSYALMKDVAHAAKKPHSPGMEFQHAPLVVLNHFTAPPFSSSSSSSSYPPSSSRHSHLQLTGTLLQSMFAPLHLPTLRLIECRRVVLFTYDASSGLIEIRQYLITAQPTGLSHKSIKKLVKGQLLDLGHLDDVDEMLDHNKNVGGGMTSDSEMEGEDSKIELPERLVGRGNRVNHKSAIRLKEIGPRLSLLLIKIEDGFCQGTVLYHHYMTKSDAEIKQMKIAKEQKKREREARRKEQEINVRLKRGQDEDEGDEEKQGKRGEDAEEDEEKVEQDDLNEDEKWYEFEVGSRPDPSVFGKGDGKRARETEQNDRQPFKRSKREGEETSERGEEEKEKRSGGRRVGAGPRKPWVRGRGGSDTGSRGRGRGGRGRGDRGSRGSSRGRGSSSSRGRGGRGSSRGRGG